MLNDPVPNAGIYRRRYVLSGGDRHQELERNPYLVVVAVQLNQGRVDAARSSKSTVPMVSTSCLSRDATTVRSRHAMLGTPLEEIDLPGAERAATDFLNALGCATDTAATTDTPARMTQAYAEMLSPGSST